MTTKITEKNVSNLANVGVEWQAVITGAGSSSSATAGKGYFINTTSNTHTLNLPSSPNIGDTVTVKDYAGTFATNSVTVGRNGNNIEGNTEDIVLSTNFAVLELVYIDSTKGWIATSTGAEQGLAPEYISATGGTVSTVNTDYKVHTFTGDGCFVVATAGNAVGSNTVDYLVIAGGGGGGNSGPPAGGGGAGGYRESSGAASGCYTASPLGACVSALPVSATTYPVTVGSGGGTAPGPAHPAFGNPGTPSVFSTITSTGGGHGAGYTGIGNCGGFGGSGGGGTSGGGGAGNTPPVSPPQGNPGSPSSGPFSSAGAGGGAGGAGACTPGPSTGGTGGPGVSSSITGSSVERGGGGGGANNGGAGPGGGGSAPNGDGTANKGGGGGGNGGGGGSGFVVIRYKFQN